MGILYPDWREMGGGGGDGRRWEEGEDGRRVEVMGGGGGDGRRVEEMKGGWVYHDNMLL